MPVRRKKTSDKPPAPKKAALTQSADIGLKSGESAVSEQAAFEEIVGLIEQSRLQAVRAVNTTLIDLYWNVGEYISHKIQCDGWGKGTVQTLSVFVQKMQPGLRGFSPQNIWRMRQFFETYRDEPILSPLLRELPWSSKSPFTPPSKLQADTHVRNPDFIHMEMSCRRNVKYAKM